MADPVTLAALAERVARAAGALLTEQAAAGSAGVQTKSSPTDLVSAADRASESLIGSLLAEARPDDGVLGEEGAGRPSRSGLLWVFDPLDGTTNYLFGFPQWAVSVACEDAAGPLAACVHDPGRGETFVAGRGHGATLDGRPIRTTARTELATALVATGFGYAASLRTSQARQLVDVIGRVRDVRRGGSAALDLAWVACGRLDGFYEAGLGRWDWAAGLLLVEEAGGRVVAGSSPHGPEQVVAAGPGIFAELAALVGLDEPSRRGEGAG
jgi:myo-inositol-1(or 4)-monophosphatase